MKENGKKVPGLLSWGEAGRLRREWAARNEKVVFTNGCFDLLHAGHVKLLEDARKLGDHLIVGLNSDESVRRIKGPRRPVNDQNERAEVLGGLKAVDAVVIFDEDDPLELIKHLEPDVLVKGGDWAPENIIGADVVKARGGHVEVVPVLEGRSTSAVLAKIRNSGEKAGGETRGKGG